MWTKVMDGETVVGVETVRLRKDGRAIPIALTVSSIRDAAGRVTGVSSIARDISAAKALEVELLSARERERAHRIWLEAVIEHTPEGIIILDEKGTVALQNAVSASFGSPDGTPDPSGKLLPHDIRTPSGERLSSDALPLYRALLHGETTSACELAIVLPIGELVPVLASAAPVDVDGQRRGAIAIFRDIRALKKLERERAEWASVVAHDLRQPTAAIRLAAELLVRVEGPPKMKAAENIRRATERLERMISDLLDVSCIDADHLAVRSERASLSVLMGEVLEASPKIASRCRTNVDPEAEYAMVDGGRFIQVLSNLLSNADKYSDSGTPIDVRVERAETMVRVSVTNEGPGIAQDEIPQLFSRFGRTRSAQGSTLPGLGLGLYICRGVVEALGGRLWVESQPSEKTHFRFTLPRAASLVDRPAAERDERRGFIH